MIKRILSYILMFGLSIGLNSCDNFLDIVPVGKVIPTTATEFRALLTEAYSYVPDDRGLASFRSDEVLMDATLSANDIDSYRDIWCWNDYTAGENTASFKWRQFYHVLFIANYTIEKENEITDGTRDDIRQMVGEAYMLRAYMHFLLANLHAPAYTSCDPTITKAIPLKLDSDVEGILTRSTLAEVYESILSDLESARGYLLTDQWDLGYNYRFNTLSVDALLSRVYLYMGRWNEALTSSISVIRQKPNLSDLASETPNQYNSVENIVALEQVMSAQYAKAIKVDREFYKKYETTDLRRKAYFNQITTSNILLVKGGSNKYSCTLRTGEMYLNAAEAAWHLGQYDIARGYLDNLQSKRFTESGYISKKNKVDALSDAELISEIYEERARELAFEGHRWFDLRRTTRPQLTKTFRGETFILEENDPRYTIRIPSEAIEANPGLAD